tara:strand:+ start:359 stop:793 length:435 start_codon:yes stop_codon:yes gene_type:complete
MSALGQPVNMGQPAQQASTAASNSALLAQGTNDLMEWARERDKEAAIQQIQDIVEENEKIARESRREVAQITAPTSRAGYLVAFICGLLLFMFISTYVFAGNRLLIGAMTAVIALFFIVAMKNTLEKKGARYLAETTGVAMGVA